MRMSVWLGVGEMEDSVYKQDSYGHTWNKTQTYISLVGILLYTAYTNLQT